MKRMDNYSKVRLISKKSIVIFISIICILIISVSYLLYKYQEKSIRQQKYSELKTLADFKQHQIEEWINERIADINVISKSPTFINAISDFLQNNSDLELNKDIIQRLQLALQFGYENIIIFSPDFKIIASASSFTTRVDSITKLKISEAFSNKKITFTDLYFSMVDNRIHYDIIAPVSHNDSIIALMLFRRNPFNFLYPLIQKWPAKSPTAETSILRVENDSVLFLNQLRYKNNTALKLKLSLSKKNAPSVQAALGNTGIFEGIDYRGIEVLSDIRTIPATNWIMVSKIDKKEIFSDLYLLSVLIAGFAFLLISLFGAGLAFFYNSRQKNIYRELYKKEKELWQHQEKFKVVMDSLGDGIIITDINAKIQYMNTIAEELAGWNFREARGRTLSEIYHVRNEETGLIENNILDKVIKHGIVKELANHTILLSKNGKEIPVMDTGAPIYDSDGSVIGIVISFQDETEKRKQTKLIKENERRLRSTLDNMLEGCQILSFDWIYLYINKSAEKHNRRPNSELIGNNYIEMWPGIEKTEIFKIIKKCMDERIPNSLENEFIFPDGSKGCFELSIEPIPEGIFILSMDITERKKIELEKLKTAEELRKSNLKIQRIISDLKDLYWTANLDGGILEVSNTFKNFYGRPVEDFYADPQLWIEMVHPDDKEIAQKSGEDLLKYGKVEAEYRIIKADGTLKWILDRKSLITDETGKPYQMGGITKDITERKKAEEELYESEEKYRTLAEAARDVVFVVDRKHQIRYVNLHTANLMGRQMSEIVAQPIESVFPPAIAAEIVRELDAVFSECKDRNIEMLVPFPSGEFWWNTSLSMLHDSAGVITAVMGVSRDITERKQAEEELRKKDELLAALADAESELLTNLEIRDALQNSLKIIGTCTNIDRVYIFENHFDEKTQEYCTSQKYEWCSADTEPQINNPDLQNVPFSAVESFMKPLKENHTFNGIVKTFPEDETKEILQSQNILSILVFPLFVQDSFWGFVGFDECKYEREWSDAEFSLLQSFASAVSSAIERENRNRDLVKAKEKAEEMSRLKSNFFANMSHELRTPLIGIIGFADFLRQDLVNPELIEMSENIFQSGIRLSETLNLILDLTKFESDKFELNLVTVDLVTETNVIINNFKNSAEIKGLSLMSSFSHSSIPFITDLRFYHSILNNLINNAIKFSNFGGVSIDISLSENFVEIKIVDTGIGVPFEYQELIFQEFRQVSEGLNRNYEGTGLGLCITKKAVEKLMGTISIASQVGKGSTFLVRLPVNIASLSSFPLMLPKVGKDISRGSVNTEKILALLIDDDPFVSPVLKRYLGDRFNLESAPNAELALKLITSKIYNIIFMDINLKSGMDGKQATQYIRKLKEYQSTPIVAITAYAMVGDKEEFLQAGCSHYLSKPFYLQDVLNLIGEIIF